MPLKNAPVGGSGSTDKTLGVGSPVLSGLGIQDNMSAKDWEGACIVWSGGISLSGLSAGPSVILFLSRSCLSFALPAQTQISLIRGIAFTLSGGFAAAIASIGQML